MSIDPFCAFHNKRWSEHEGGKCLYCCLCFSTLTPDECYVDPNGTRWDVCVPCHLSESLAPPTKFIPPDTEELR